jgi:hypothetical protein
MKLRDIIYEKDCYIYSTSYTFSILFPFAPLTTVAPLNLDWNRAVSIMWNRKERDFLPALHEAVYKAVSNWGLDPLYRLALLAFTHLGGPHEGLKLLAKSARQAGVQFAFADFTISCMHSFVPRKGPSHSQCEEARGVWANAIALGRPAPLPTE